MKFPYISRNGEIIPAAQGVVPLDKTEISYGFGVYETVKVRKQKIYFLPQHIERLLHSAREIHLIHRFSPDSITNAFNDLVRDTLEESYNVKILLYGAPEVDNTELFILPSAPLYPERKWYREGVSLQSFRHERWMPKAKTLNMLPSYFYYKKAKENGCYDALLYDSQGNLREGTRTNVYVIKGKQLISPQKKDVLEGVTMMSLEKIIAKTDYTIEYKDIPIRSLGSFDGMCISSTSSKLLPVKKVDSHEFPVICQGLLDLIELYDEALERSGGDFEQL